MAREAVGRIVRPTQSSGDDCAVLLGRDYYRALARCQKATRPPLQGVIWPYDYSIVNRLGKHLDGLKSGKRPTLEDVARLAQVAPMTVSRVITNHRYVSQLTAEKVRAAILQLNYQPNHAARVLNGQLTRSIGLIVPDVADGFFSAISHAVQETARASGYVVLLAASNDDPEIEAALIEQMTYHPVDGILLVPADSKRGHLAVTASAGIPLVAIDRRIEVAQVDSVEVRNRRGARVGVEHLVEHGCTRIVCIAKNSQLPPIRERIAGYHQCLRRANLQAKTLRITNEPEAENTLIALLSSRRKPDALFTTNNSATLWTINILNRTNVKIGRDIALVGFDDVDFYTLLHPSITAIRQPTVELGETSARLLLKRIHGDPLPPFVHSLLPVCLIARESCGCAQVPPTLTQDRAEVHSRHSSAAPGR